jgi:hypothetical protein
MRALGAGRGAHAWAGLPWPAARQASLPRATPQRAPRDRTTSKKVRSADDLTLGMRVYHVKRGTGVVIRWRRARHVPKRTL